MTRHIVEARIVVATLAEADRIAGALAEALKGESDSDALVAYAPMNAAMPRGATNSISLRDGATRVYPDGARVQ